MKKISRFVFNFRSRCNMCCPFCYIPFVDESAGDLDTWKAIVDKIAQYDPDIVTFGGGDPFAHEGFIRLLEYCRQFSFQVHVDTNAIKMPLDQMEKIKRLVDIIGVPLDGNRQQHDTARKYPGHFDIVTQSLRALEEYAIPAKINTVYFPEEKDQLRYIAEEIGAHSNIKQWFIYEYWHFDGINAQAATLPAGQSAIALNYLKKVSGVKDVYYSTVADRSPAYIFVSSAGSLYTVGEDMCSYIELGSIFDESAALILSTLENTEFIDKRAQLKQVATKKEDSTTG